MDLCGPLIATMIMLLFTRRGRVPDYDAPVVVPATKCTVQECQDTRAGRPAAAEGPGPAAASGGWPMLILIVCPVSSLYAHPSLAAGAVQVCARVGFLRQASVGHSHSGTQLPRGTPPRRHRVLSLGDAHVCSSLVWFVCLSDAPQKCGKEHVLADEDVVQIVKKIAG